MIARVVALVALVALVACAEPRALAPDAAARATDAGSAPLDVTTCTDCHASVTHEWLASAHHRAFTNDVFQNEWLLHRDPWCVRCHAPLADASAPSGREASDGVSCVVCHVRGGEIVSTHASPDASHAVRADPSFATEAQCARCHSVKFPPTQQFHGARVAPGQVLQRTVDEWRASGADGPCQSCHMPELAAPRAHRSHAFPGGRDDALLAHALRVSASATCERGETRVLVVLEADRVGHAVPTGDVFRRLEVHATLDGRAATTQTATLTRRFGLDDRHELRETSDARVPARGARTVELALPGCGRRVDWNVEWLALDGDVAAARALDDADVRRTLSRGVVPVASRP